MKRIATGLFVAASYANADMFLQHLELKTPAPTMTEDGLKACQGSHCSDIGSLLAETCKKNSWEAGHIVPLFDLGKKEACFCACPSGSNFGTFVAPEGAKSILPEETARERALEVDNFRPLDDKESLKWATDVINYHKNFYPTVEFHLKWDDNTVNAYAWRENDKKHVAILGGLVRYKSMNWEGVAVTLAHELGHHYAGRDRNEYPLSCEGMADYEGVRDIMRKVWFGEQYVEVAKKGIPQLGALLGAARPDDPTMPNPDKPWGCSHPEAQCRVATYFAALSLEHAKPKCAGTEN